MTIGRSPDAEVFLDDDDRPRDVHTTDRWADLPGGPVRALWSTPVSPPSTKMKWKPSRKREVLSSRTLPFQNVAIHENTCTALGMATAKLAIEVRCSAIGPSASVPR